MSEMQKAKGEFIVSEHDKELIESLLTKVDEARQQNERMTVVAHEDLPSVLSADEIEVIDRVYAIEPAHYGFKGPRLAIEPLPDTLVRVEPQPYQFEGRQYYTNVQFVPEAPYSAFRKLADAMEIQIGRKLLIESSYRSNAFQAITFLSILKINRFDVPKTARRAAIPGYSEHSTPSQLALDVQTIDGLPTDETPQDFEGTQEYEWLVANAADFDFYMSYPKNNPHGLMFEPWHWRHKPSRSL